MNRISIFSKCSGINFFRLFASRSSSASKSSKFVPPPAPLLNSLIKLDMWQDKASDVVSEMWSSHYKQKPGTLSAVIDEDVYRTLYRRIESNKVFLLPLPRNNENGDKVCVVVLMEAMTWSNPFEKLSSNPLPGTLSLSFTSLEHYKQMQKDKGSPNIWMRICIYSELLHSHQLALLHGTFHPAATNSPAPFDPHLHPSEAEFLFNSMRMLYLDNKRYPIVKRFTHDPKSYKVEHALAALTV